MICSKCGFQNSPGSNVCAKCGNSLEMQQNPQEINSINIPVETSQSVDNNVSPVQAQPVSNPSVNIVPEENQEQNNNNVFPETFQSISNQTTDVVTPNVPNPSPNINPTINEFSNINTNSPVVNNGINMNNDSKQKNNKLFLIIGAVAVVAIIIVSIIFLIPTKLEQADYENYGELVTEFDDVLFDLQYLNDNCSYSSLKVKESAQKCISTIETDIKKADEKLNDLLKDKVTKNDKEVKTKVNAIKDAYNSKKPKYNIDIDITELLMPFEYIESPGYLAEIDETISYYSNIRNEISAINVLKDNETIKTKLLSLLDDLDTLSKKYKATEGYEEYSQTNDKIRELNAYFSEISESMDDSRFDNCVEKTESLIDYLSDIEFEE